MARPQIEKKERMKRLEELMKKLGMGAEGIG